MQSIQISSRNVIHAKKAFDVYRHFNVLHMFAHRIINHKFAIYHMVDMDYVVQLVETLPIVSRFFK